MSGSGEKPDPGAAMRGLSPLGPARQEVKLPQLPRSHRLEAEAAPVRRSGWRRWLRWIGLPVLGGAALLAPRPVGEAVLVQSMPATPTASDGRAQDPVLLLLNQLDGRGTTSPGAVSPFDTIIGRVAGKAADLAIDACLLLAAKGVWHLACAVRARQRAREETGKLDAGEADGAAELARLNEWIDAQDRAMIAAAEPEAPMPDESGLLAMGRRMFERMRQEVRDMLCAEKGMVRKLAGDSTREVAEQLRRVTAKGEVTTAMSLALAGLAAAVARVGFEAFCSPRPTVLA